MEEIQVISKENEVSNEIQENEDSKLEKGMEIVEDVINELPDNIDDSRVVKFFKKQFNKIKLNEQIRKDIAKELSIEDQKAMKWETVSDVLACLDLSNLAGIFDKEAAKAIRIIVKAFGVKYAVFAKFGKILEKQSDEKVAQLAKYALMPTPGHVLHALSNKFKKKSDDADKLIEQRKSEIEGANLDIEQIEAPINEEEKEK